MLYIIIKRSHRTRRTGRRRRDGKESVVETGRKRERREVSVCVERENADLFIRLLHSPSRPLYFYTITALP